VVLVLVIDLVLTIMRSRKPLNHPEWVEVQAAVLFAVGADTADLAKAKGRFVADEYKRADFLLEAPLGGQEELWWAMIPGTPTGRTSLLSSPFLLQETPPFCLWNYSTTLISVRQFNERGVK